MAQGPRSDLEKGEFSPGFLMEPLERGTLFFPGDVTLGGQTPGLPETILATLQRSLSENKANREGE